MQHAGANLVRWCAAVALAIGVVGVVVPAAQAYPATVCTVSVSPRNVVGGHPITVKGTSNTAIDWTVTLKKAPQSPGHFQTRVAHGHGKTFMHVFHVPKVSSSVHLEVVSSCGGSTTATVSAPMATGTGTGGAGGGHHANEAGPATGGGGGGVLPNTGGPAWWVALLGLGLLISGSVSMRRRVRH